MCSASSQRFDGLGFSDALENLASQAGVELPARWAGKRAQDTSRYERLHDALERAEKYYGRILAGDSGASARRYLEERGIERTTIEAFGLGLSPAEGNPLLEVGRREGRELASALVESGLVRNGEGRSYDFFHGRLMIPIRDGRGRTVGFGARLLGDSSKAPKYVNTPETPVFHKGRLIYGLDRAIESVRRTRHMILVEGYTDVMAAHQVGFGHVAAILGTSTTEDHAALVRRTGARRVTLVFDGDEAGRRATFRALAGLLPLQLELDVLRLPGGQDPCDLFVSEGAAGFEERLGDTLGWLDFALEGLASQTGRALSDGVDEVLRLVLRLPKPVHRESSMARISEVLELPADAIRMQARDLVGRRSAALAERGAGPRRGELVDRPGARATAERQARAEGATSPEQGEAAGAEVEASERARPTAEREQEVDAYRHLVGAILLDNSLIPAVSDQLTGCPDEGIGQILATILDLYENDDAEIDASRVMDALGAHPAREWVVPIEELARSAESTRLVAEGAVQFLSKLNGRRSIDQHRSQFARAGDDASRSSALMNIWNENRRLKVPASDTTRAVK